ncbi:division/cell wall cluster transcriptional repressor MraZ [Pacificoceanicola onchidii]|uniref:division/cell wall cluster transcriptional repressor MraZ n=1 Tax=Pacificoceanicola onchidii TaxID=2562685 RepID=UPI0010A52E22|nr:division/cell wall cluster transcriptional repressor MraZ [Pacificoceanicola onchidii]
MSRRLRFRGEFTNKVDTKGRVSIPAPFRRVLQAGDPDWTEGLNPNFVIVYGDPKKPYLECFTVEEMEAVEDRIAAMPRGSKKRKLLEYIYSTQSVTTSVDETGRIVLSAALRKKAGISGEAYFASNLDTFQIWQPAAFEEENRANAEALLEDLPEDFDLAQLLDEEDEVL